MARATTAGAALVTLALFSLTLGPAVVTGALPGPVAGLLPAAAEAAPVAAGLALFLAGAALTAVLALGAGALALRRLGA